MKILYVGAITPNSLALVRKKALEDIGMSVTAYSTCFDGRDTHSYKGSFYERVRWKLGYPVDEVNVNKKIKEEIRTKEFDVLWVDKGNTITPETLKSIKKLNPKVCLVSTSLDDMYALHNRSKYYTKSLPHYDLVFTTKSYNCDSNELPSLGAKKVIFHNNGFDSHSCKPMNVTNEDIKKYGSDVGFIGAYEEERANSILYLANHGIKVRIWGGSGWLKWEERHPNIIIEKVPLFGEEYAKAFSATKINLCFLRKRNRDLQTTRSIEIPACGAFMLAERTSEHLRLFKEGEEAEYFSSNEELLNKIKYYLEHHELRITIAKKGRDRCIQSQYSYQDYAKFFIQHINKWKKAH